MRRRLARKRPALSDAEIAAAVAAWYRSRPGAELGDSPGRLEGAVQAGAPEESALAPAGGLPPARLYHPPHAHLRVHLQGVRPHVRGAGRVFGRDRPLPHLQVQEHREEHLELLRALGIAPVVRKWRRKLRPERRRPPLRLSRPSPLTAVAVDRRTGPGVLTVKSHGP